MRGGTTGASPPMWETTRSTRPVINDAFHSPHTWAGGLRVGFGERAEQVGQHGVVTQRLGDVRDDLRIGGITTSHHLMDQQVMANHLGEDLAVGGPEPETTTDGVGEPRTDGAVITPRPFPRSCSRAPSSNRSGRGTSVVSSDAPATVSIR